MTPKKSARRAMMLTLGFDAAMAGLTMILATAAVWYFKGATLPFPSSSLILTTCSFIIIAIIGFLARGVQKQVWRHLCWPDALGIIQGVGLTALLFIPAILILNGALFSPWPILFVTLILWTMALFIGRMVALMRSTRAPLQIFRSTSKTGQPILLVGDVESSVELLRRIQSDERVQKLRILGLVEVQGAEPGRAIRGVPIMGGLSQLGEVIDILTVRYDQKPWIAVTGTARVRETMLDILETAALHGAEIMALAPDGTSQALEPVHPADLLYRNERQLDPTPVQNIVANKNVIVTGGGGTIGSEISRQLATFEPNTLALIDSSEFNLYTIDMDLNLGQSPTDIIPIFGDVRDAERLSSIFQQTQPDLVIHAAALKHVPLMEANPCEAVLTNVGGALNAVKLAISAGAAHFVFISTDKAVDPDNVMGATKRLAEIIVARYTKNTSVAASMVRFGNVLGSSGSVVPLFEKQINQRGPVTVTDPDVTRYFMTVEEASSLVLQASALGVSGNAELFVLDMGEPMRIYQLAETMIRLKGLVPGQDIMIETIGMRAGEKMHEELTYAHETVVPTQIEGIQSVTCTAQHNSLFDKQLSALLEAAARRDEAETLRLLGLLVPEYGKNLREKARRHSA